MACCSKICVAEEISVYDPDTDQRFILRDGEMIKEDLEAGNTFSSSPPSTAHVPETDDIDITDLEEMNDNLGLGDEDNFDEVGHDEGLKTKKKLAHDNAGVETKKKLAHGDRI